MSKLSKYKNLTEVAAKFRQDLTGIDPTKAALPAGKSQPKGKDLVLFFAHNGTGKTRLSMAFKELGKKTGKRDTLYFNAFTEDLFSWNNDLEHDETRVLKLNKDSAFFDGLEELEMKIKIEPFYQTYVDVNFDIDYEKYEITFSRSVVEGDTEKKIENIKISRGEENLFIWCFFLAICELAIDEAEAYDWVKYIYIDDPISSLDENKAVAVACDLAKLIKRKDNKTKTVVSTHHSLFYNVMFNEFKKKRCCYFLHSNGTEGYALQETSDTPFFHHIAVLGELKKAAESDVIHTYHFNSLRSVMEKTVSFLGYSKINQVIHGLEGEEDDVLFNRAVQLFSHGRYSVFTPIEMGPDNKNLFKRILNGFINKYEFQFPEIFNAESETPTT